MRVLEGFVGLVVVGVFLTLLRILTTPPPVISPAKEAMHAASTSHEDPGS
jgi:hypothetical protein